MSEQRKRCLELIAFVASALLIVAVILCYLLTNNNNKTSSMKFKFPCEQNSTHYMKNITEDAVSYDNGSVTSSGLVYYPGSYWRTDGEVWGCPCMVVPCIYKCCAEGIFHGIKDSVKTHTTGGIFDDRFSNCVYKENIPFTMKHSKVYSTDENDTLKEVPVDESHFKVLIKGPSCTKVTLTAEESKGAFILSNGTIFRNYTKTSRPYLDYTEFCVEMSNNSLAVNVKVCSSSMMSGRLVQGTKVKGTQGKEFLVSGSFIVSVPFLLMTVLIYSSLPQLRNLHGKSIICHSTSLLVSFALLAFANFMKDKVNQITCTAIGK